MTAEQLIETVNNPIKRGSISPYADIVIRIDDWVESLESVNSDSYIGSYNKLLLEP